MKKKITKTTIFISSLLAGLLVFSNFCFAQNKSTSELQKQPKIEESKLKLIKDFTENGMRFYQAGKLNQAARQFSQAISLAREEKNDQSQAANLLNLGNVKSAEKDYEGAHKDYLESAAIAEAKDFHSIAIKAFSNLAKTSFIQNQEKQSESFLIKAYRHCGLEPETSEKAELMLGLARVFLDHGLTKAQGEKIYKLLEDSSRIVNKFNLKELQSYADGYMGMLYLAQSRLDEALPLTIKAEFLAQNINRPDILFRWQWQNARILAKQGKTEQAIANYQQAISTLQPIRATLYSQQFSGASIKVGDLYSEFADLKMKGKNLSEKDLLSLRNILEEGKVVELESYYRDDCVTAWLNKATPIDHVVSKTAAIYPVMFADRLEILLSLPDRLRRYTVPKDREEIKELADQFRATLENRATPEYLPYAQALYDVLIQPIKEDLSKNEIDTLVFVPDSTFRTIPLAALHDGENFLIKQFAVAISPGLTLTETSPLQETKPQVLVAGLSQPTLGFQALPNVSHEIKSVANEFPATILEDSNFRIDSISKKLLNNPYRIVHIASHGQFGNRKEDTFVLASDGKIKLDDLSKMMGVNRYRTEPVDLLALSACQTAAGDDQAALGLAGIAVKSGARSALASLWFINDPASADLIAEFYKQIKVQGTTKAKALQQAQLYLINGIRYEHPAYWAPFLMIGNWL